MAETVNGGAANIQVAKAPAKTSNPIHIPSMELQRISVSLVGDSPLIVHAWSAKAKQEMLAKQQKKAKGGREKRNPKKEYEESLYHHPEGGYGFPSGAFKQAAVRGAKLDPGIAMTDAKSAFHVEGELTKIYGSEPQMREDMVKIGSGVADLRYRGEFTQWVVNFIVAYNAAAISDEQIINLFNVSGFGTGVGEWRPEKNGNFGRFHVSNGDDMEFLATLGL